jgi:hypothetical protein
MADRLLDRHVAEFRATDVRSVSSTAPQAPALSGATKPKSRPQRTRTAPATTIHRCEPRIDPTKPSALLDEDGPNATNARGRGRNAQDLNHASPCRPREVLQLRCAKPCNKDKGSANCNEHCSGDHQRVAVICGTGAQYKTAIDHDVQ